eukprot:331179-Prorocentrum_minimum.AAC.1
MRNPDVRGSGGVQTGPGRPGPRAGRGPPAGARRGRGPLSPPEQRVSSADPPPPRPPSPWAEDSRGTET